MKEMSSSALLVDFTLLTYPSIFDKMINQLISNNYDVVIGINEEKGSVFLDDFKRKKLIFNGEVPKKLRLDKVLVSRIGLCTVIRSSVLSSGSIFSGRIGYFPINNHMSFMEFTNKKGISKNLKQLIINHNKKILLVTGGTGGHIYPALSVFKHLKNNSCKSF